MVGRKKLTSAEPITDPQIVEQTPPAIAAQEIALHEHQQTASELFGIPPDATADELLAEGVRAFNIAGYQMARAGAAFSACQNRFDKPLREIAEETGVSAQHVLNAIQLARYIESLPPAAARRMMAVPYTKVLAVAKADPEVVEALLEEGALDGDNPLTVRDLRAALRDAQERLDKATTATKEAVAAAVSTKAENQKLRLTLPQREPDETLRNMFREFGGLVRDMQAAASALREGANAITQHADEHELDHDEDIGTNVLNAIRPVIGLIADLRTVRGIDAPARFALEILSRPDEED